MILSKLLKNITTENKLIDGKINISDIQIDSRKVKNGSLFICISGFAVDGHLFANMAQKNGAVAIICEREIQGVSIPCIIVKDTRIALTQIASNFHENPETRMKLIGVTGTNGKTTVTHLVKSILDYCGFKSGLIGTMHNMICDKVQPASMTTPDPIEFFRLLRQMSDKGCEYVVMEVSSHALALNKLYGCSFEVGAFTNLTQDHLDFHNTMDEYFSAKAKLFNQSKKSVINIDDNYGEKLIKSHDNSLSIGINKDANISATNINLKADCVNFMCTLHDSSAKIKLNIPGEFSVYNALITIGICSQLGLTLDEIASGLSVAKGVKGRVEVVPTGKKFTILIDYAHTPDALENVLKTIRKFAKGRVVALFGCGGDRDRTKRPLMGNIAINLADFSIITSDNPRTEPPMQIIDDIVTGIIGNKDKFVVIENRFEAIKYAIHNAKKDDIILLAGKGHETYQVLMDKTIDFDERKVIKMCLNA